MRYGLSEKDIQQIREVLASYPAVQKAILYGSRANNTYRNGSDIDLTLIGNQLDFSILCSIENDLDDLLLPYHIDLSIQHQIDNPSLLDHIQRIGKVFYTRASFLEN